MMKKLLKNSRGETLVETLFAILIFTLASIALYSMITSAAAIDGQVRERDLKIQEQLAKIEAAQNADGTGAAEGSVAIYAVGSVGSQPLDTMAVRVFGGKEDPNGSIGLYAYYPAAQGDLP